MEAVYFLLIDVSMNAIQTGATAAACSSINQVIGDLPDDRFIWPEGYIALRKFNSIADPNVYTVYKMEVLRDEDSKIRPLFRVTLDNEEQIKGSTPSACWKKIYKRMKLENGTSNSIDGENGLERVYESGSDMFGFSNPQVIKLIKALPPVEINFVPLKQEKAFRADELMEFYKLPERGILAMPPNIVSLAV
ncbi:hypothetical protein K2173_026992 [Erythroxylum novogranatense]|uniref:Uncharacterized protein n=1 Tax=Erythroxylum novogranatense TaxID=1862640 RepID=A0AAV8U0A7_9ROSI|nr:hypothetical protein K2173_026992 [Erythroxylum novogranatense]